MATEIDPAITLGAEENSIIGQIDNSFAAATSNSSVTASDGLPADDFDEDFDDDFDEDFDDDFEDDLDVDFDEDLDDDLDDDLEEDEEFEDEFVED